MNEFTFFLTRIISAGCFAIGMRFCLYLVFKEDEKNMEKLLSQPNSDHFVIRHYKVCLYVGIPGTIFLQGCAVLSFFSKQISWMQDMSVNNSIFCFSTLFCISLIGVYLIVSYIVWRVDGFEERDYFTYRSLYGKKHTVYYSDCKSFEIGKDVLIIKTETRNYRVGLMLNNVQDLIFLLRKNKVKQSFPKIKTPKKAKVIKKGRLSKKRTWRKIREFFLG